MSSNFGGWNSKGFPNQWLVDGCFAHEREAYSIESTPKFEKHTTLTLPETNIAPENLANLYTKYVKKESFLHMLHPEN